MSGHNSFGLISGFNHQQQDWKTYNSRLNQWFIANDVTNETDKTGVKRRATLLSALSEATFQLASNLALPAQLEMCKFEEVVNLLDKHFTPKRCGFAERHHFYIASQKTGEGHSQWAARLRGLAAYCNFKNLEDALLDRFVMGMVPGLEREKLFSHDIAELTLSKAVDLAESTRCARAGAASSSATASVTPVENQMIFKVNKAGRYNKTEKCNVCGRSNHKSNECRFAEYKCKRCNKKGHLRRMCKRIKYVETGEVSEDDDGKLYNIQSSNGAPMYETICVKNNLNLTFEVDSGSAVTAISDYFYRLHFKEIPLSPCIKKLWGYTKKSFNCLGTFKLPVSYSGRTIVLVIYVIKDGGPPILGRDFISKFGLHLIPVNYCDIGDQSNANMVDEFPELFSGKLGCFNKYQVHLPLKSDAKPIFCKARTVAFALKEKVNEEIERLVQLGIIEPIEHSEYASPIVPVLKRDGTVRICADYSRTINKQLLVEKYPLPTIDELFSRLSGAQVFSKLDMSLAYNQICIVDPENITAINTNRGLFKYNRLIFGLASAPAIFQRALHSVVGDLEGVCLFLDDILIGTTRDQHLDKLNLVLTRLRKAGLTLHRDKCVFFQSEVSYLGYKINKDGIRKLDTKVKAILESPIPKKLSELQSFLGLINYYRIFLPAASSVLSPLYDLLKKGSKWSWGTQHDKAFNEIKQLLASDKVLAHFNPNAKLILTVDASPTGLGAVLSQIEADESERPISFASRTLNSAEKNYAQIQKEATAIVFGVKKFHQYLYGRADPFILRTDHKPLISIFGPHRGVPEITANRLQRYAIFLSAYNYEIEYVRSANNVADFLSRASLEQVEPASNKSSLSSPQAHNSTDTSTSIAMTVSGDRCSDLITHTPDPAAYVNFIVAGNLPITIDEVRLETGKDLVLKKVIKFIHNGWPRKITDNNIKPYHQCKSDLAVENGCVMRGHKLIIPTVLRNKILTELHSSHFGIVKCKAEARSRFWFPGVDAAIEKLISECELCIKLRPSPRRAPFISWEFPSKPFERIHIDFLGPINDHSYLVIVDAFSKWVECFNLKNNTTSKRVVDKLHEFMSRFGIPEKIVSDNGTSFTSEEFKTFCSLNGIVHITSPVYHPASNGQVETYVKIIKKGIKSTLLSIKSIRDLDSYLYKYLFDYRNSKHSTTERSPAELVFGRRLHSRLDLLNPSRPFYSSPDLTSIVKRNQCLQNKHFKGTLRPKFKDNESVMYKSYINKNKFMWREGKILRKIGKVMYLLEDTFSKKVVKRHINQITKYKKYAVSDNSNGNEIQSQLPIQDSSNIPSDTTESPQDQWVVTSSTPGSNLISPQTTENMLNPTPSDNEEPARSSRMALRNIPRIDYKIFF